MYMNTFTVHWSCRTIKILFGNLLQKLSLLYIFAGRLVLYTEPTKTKDLKKHVYDPLSCTYTTFTTEEMESFERYYDVTPQFGCMNIHHDHDNRSNTLAIEMCYRNFCCQSQLPLSHVPSNW